MATLKLYETRSKRDVWIAEAKAAGEEFFELTQATGISQALGALNAGINVVAPARAMATGITLPRDTKLEVEPRLEQSGALFNQLCARVHRIGSVAPDPFISEIRPKDPMPEGL